jgi:glycerol-3-phosphate dehydrogenase
MKEYDVIIVGGGIHGAGVLQAAAAAGHSALLIEKRALASGTSSRSSKLIHGGLRYLESSQFSLVRESLRERAVHLRIAPELVELRPFFIPVYSDTRRRPWQLKIGLALYALLGGFSAGTSFGSVPKHDWPTAAPSSSCRGKASPLSVPPRRPTKASRTRCGLCPRKKNICWTSCAATSPRWPA